MYNQNFINYIIDKFELYFIDSTESKYNIVYKFKKSDITYKFSITNYKSTELKELPNLHISLTSNKILSETELYSIYSKFGYNLNLHSYINSFFNKMFKLKFANNHVLKENFDMFSIFRNSSYNTNSTDTHSRYDIDIYSYDIKPYFYGKVFYNDAVKEKNEKKLAQSSSVEIKPEFRLKKDKIFFQNNVKLPFTFKNKLHFYINEETDIREFDIYIEKNILEILRKKIVSKKILKKNEAENLNFEELQKYIPYLEILNY